MALGLRPCAQRVPPLDRKSGKVELGTVRGVKLVSGYEGPSCRLRGDFIRSYITPLSLQLLTIGKEQNPGTTLAGLIICGARTGGAVGLLPGRLSVVPQRRPERTG